MSNKNLFYNQSNGPPNYIHIQPEKISHVYRWPQMHMTVFCGHIFSARSMAKTANQIYFFLIWSDPNVQGRVHGPDHKLQVQIGVGPLPHFHATWCSPVLGTVEDFYAKIKCVGATLSYAYRSRNQILSTIKQLGYLCIDDQALLSTWKDLISWNWDQSIEPTITSTAVMIEMDGLSIRSFLPSVKRSDSECGKAYRS